MSASFDHSASNLSIPATTVIPVLHYPDVPAAVVWLCGAFGFSERLRIGTHRVQLNVGSGAVVVAEAAQPSGAASTPSGHSIMIRVHDIDRHYAHARLAGARLPDEPVTHPYGERQYTAIDPAGHAWTFSQTVANIDPASWGGILVGQE